MKYLSLVWAGLWRKRMRTILTLLSVAVAFVLFGILHGVTATFDSVIDQMSDSRLRSMSSVNVLEPLPLAHLPQIESVPGVEKVSYYAIFFGYYQEQSNGIGVGALDIERFLDSYPEVVLSSEARESMLRTRNGAIVGKDLAEEWGWQVGDTVPIRSNRWTQRDGMDDWSLEIVGIYEIEDDSFPAQELYINYGYFDEARTSGNGTVNLYFVTISDTTRATEISEQIDLLFANSQNRTQTQTEKEWIRAQISQLGDVEFFVNAIIGAVLFTLLFLTGNTMMQSVRERIPELAILKTYGFRDGAIIAIVCAEALLLCGIAAALGLALAASVFPSIFSSIGAPAVPMPYTVVAAGLGIAALLALLSASPPAWRIRRLNLVDALAGR